MHLTDEQISKAVDALAQGSDLVKNDTVEVARSVLTSIIEESGRDRDILWIALPIARRCLGAGHKPDDIAWYARQTLKFTRENRKFIEACHESLFRNDDDPEASCMAYLAQRYFQGYSDRRVH